VKSTPVSLPRDVRALVDSALGGKPAREELAWMSWAGTVWRIASDGDSVHVKRAADLEPERDRIGWLRGRWPVPEIVGFARALGDDWLVTRSLPGVPLSEPVHGLTPESAAVRFGEILRGLHDADVRGCPFGKPRAGHVLTHGDYCLPNVLLEDGKLSGVVDLGRVALASPEVDLAAGVWTLQYNFGPGFGRPFLDAYGWPPMSDAAIEKLRRRYAR
jgi:aminoglycoside phosphotransferase